MSDFFTTKNGFKKCILSQIELIRKPDIPGTYKFYYNWNNYSETAPNSIF